MQLLTTLGCDNCRIPNTWPAVGDGDSEQLFEIQMCEEISVGRLKLKDNGRSVDLMLVLDIVGLGSKPLEVWISE